MRKIHIKVDDHAYVLNLPNWYSSFPVKFLRACFDKSPVMERDSMEWSGGEKVWPWANLPRINLIHDNQHVPNWYSAAASSPKKFFIQDLLWVSIAFEISPNSSEKRNMSQGNHSKRYTLIPFTTKLTFTLSSKIRDSLLDASIDFNAQVTQLVYLWTWWLQVSNTTLSHGIVSVLNLHWPFSFPQNSTTADLTRVSISFERSPVSSVEQTRYGWWGCCHETWKQGIILPISVHLQSSFPVNWHVKSLLNLSRAIVKSPSSSADATKA